MNKEELELRIRNVKYDIEFYEDMALETDEKIFDLSEELEKLEEQLKEIENG